MRLQLPNFPLYTIYCNNFDDATQELARIEKKRVDVKHFLEVCVVLTQCSRRGVWADAHPHAGRASRSWPGECIESALQRPAAARHAPDAGAAHSTLPHAAQGTRAPTNVSIGRARL